MKGCRSSRLLRCQLKAFCCLLRDWEKHANANVLGPRWLMLAVESTAGFLDSCMICKIFLNAPATYLWDMITRNSKILTSGKYSIISRCARVKPSPHHPLGHRTQLATLTWGKKGWSSMRTYPNSRGIRSSCSSTRRRFADPVDGASTV